MTSQANPTLFDALWPEKEGQQLVRNLTAAIIGSALLTISAKIQVPFWPVPMTMQTMVVLCLGAALGSRLGTATVLLYLAEGAAGLPVFAGTPEKGLGLAYMAGPTGGYLVGFIAGAFLVGWLAERGWDRSVPRLFAAMLLGHVAIFVFGVSWLAELVGLEKAWLAGVAPFYAATLFKTALAAFLIPATWQLISRDRETE
jgi:biotin transport system substrate-specific component